jgi:hypothetical protein
MCTKNQAIDFWQDRVNLWIHPLNETDEAKRLCLDFFGLSDSDCRINFCWLNQVSMHFMIADGLALGSTIELLRRSPSLIAL